MNIRSTLLAFTTISLVGCTTPPTPTANELQSDVIYYRNTEGGRKTAEDFRRIYGDSQRVALVDQPLPDTLPPEPVFQPPPQYPPDLRKPNRKDAVTVDFIVGESGRILYASVQNSSDPELNEIVLKTVKIWRFTPARRAGIAVRFRIMTLIEFDPGH